MILTLSTGQILTEKKNTTTNWSKFKNLITVEEKPINNTEGIEAEIEKLEQEITKTAKEATTTKPQKKSESLPTHLKQLIKIKDRTKKKYHRTLHPQAKQNLTKVDLSLWRMTKSIVGNKKWNKIPPIVTQAGYAITSKEKVETFADSLDEQYRQNTTRKTKKQKEG